MRLAYRLIELIEDCKYLIRRDGWRVAMPRVARTIAALPYRHIQFLVVSRSLLDPIPDPKLKIQLELKSFEPSHLDFVSRVHLPSEANICAQRFKQGHFGLVACHQGQVVGYGWGCKDTSLERVALCLTPGDVLCTDAFTAKAFRSKGVHTALSLARWRLFRELGFKKVIAYIEINNHPSLAVWGKLGGQVVESIEFWRIGFWRRTVRKPSGSHEGNILKAEISAGSFGASIRAKNGKARGTVIKLISVSDRMADRWDSFVKKWPDFELIQSYKWGTLKEALGWKAVRLAVEQDGQLVAGAQMLLKTLPLGLASMAYIPRGPLVDWENREITNALLNALHLEALRHRAICLRIEPPLLNGPDQHDLLGSYGFQAVEHNNQPRCSITVNLPVDMDELLIALPSKTRENIRKSKRKGVTVEVAAADDFPTFYHFMEITGRRCNFPIRFPDYYEREWRTFNKFGQTQLFIARYNGIAIAAKMPFYFGKYAASFHAGALDEYRNLNAGYLLMWAAMCWAKEQGCCKFDLWGIPDEVGELNARGENIPKGKTGGLWGVYYFKRAFGGEVVYYVGAYDYVYSSLPYRITDFIASRIGSSDKMAKIMDFF